MESVTLEHGLRPCALRAPASAGGRMRPTYNQVVGHLRKES